MTQAIEVQYLLRQFQPDDGRSAEQGFELVVW